MQQQPYMTASISLWSGAPYLASCAPSSNALYCHKAPCDEPVCKLQLAYGACNFFGISHCPQCSCKSDAAAAGGLKNHSCRAALANLFCLRPPLNSTITSDLAISLQFYDKRQFVAVFPQLLVAKPGSGHSPSF